MSKYYMISDSETFAFSAENPQGTKSGGSRGEDCTKLSPTVAIRAGASRAEGMTLDNLGWTGPRYDDYTSTAYWYQTLPGATLRELPPDSELCMK